MTFPSFTRTATRLEPLVMGLLPHGGQGTARRNAWAAMAQDAARARARREADDVMTRAVERASRAAAR